VTTLLELDDGSVPQWSIDVPDHLPEETVKRVVGQYGFIMTFTDRRVVWPVDLHAAQWITTVLAVVETYHRARD